MFLKSVSCLPDYSTLKNNSHEVWKCSVTRKKYFERPHTQRRSDGSGSESWHPVPETDDCFGAKHRRLLLWSVREHHIRVVQRSEFVSTDKLWLPRIRFFGMDYSVTNCTSWTRARRHQTFQSHRPKLFMHKEEKAHPTPDYQHLPERYLRKTWFQAQSTQRLSTGSTSVPSCHRREHRKKCCRHCRTSNGWPSLGHQPCCWGKPKIAAHGQTNKQTNKHTVSHLFPWLQTQSTIAMLLLLSFHNCRCIYPRRSMQTSMVS